MRLTCSFSMVHVYALWLANSSSKDKCVHHKAHKATFVWLRSLAWASCGVGKATFKTDFIKIERNSTTFAARHLLIVPPLMSHLNPSKSTRLEAEPEFAWRLEKLL
jgi:hypothetical protein